MVILKTLTQYAKLMRLDKPIGILLLLWPTLWALWLASDGLPPRRQLWVFIIGVILMRSAGCVINDIADRHFDAYVKRTQSRPIAIGSMSVREGIVLAGSLSLSAFLLVIFNCNQLTIALAILGAIITCIYPLLKRITHLPQFGLGIAFAWGIPMAFAAIQNQIDPRAWVLFAAGAIWPILYDTMYAMVDRDDDIKIGVKSTAILFAGADKFIIAILQIIFLLLLAWCGLLFSLSNIFYCFLMIAAITFIYQQYLIKDRRREYCFHAFLNNHWTGFIIFAGIYFSLG